MKSTQSQANVLEHSQKTSSCHCLLQKSYFFLQMKQVYKSIWVRMNLEHHKLLFFFFILVLMICLVFSLSFLSFFFFFVFYFFIFSFFSLRGLKLHPRDERRQCGQDQRYAERNRRSARAVPGRTQFKQAAAKVQISGLFFQLLPQICGSLLTVCQSSGRT